ncbi:hypothetical protein H0H93_008402 [Arthromyces matolae]|nr:hypothetical protein H0H93_008402 [Arthromyces matolae]
MPPPSHPVVKEGVGHSNTFHSLTRTLPASPTGPPPSFGTREQWINSLPTWRRTKPRRIWEEDTHSAERRFEQVFCPGLTDAGNAPVIKGTHAEARFPPLNCPLTASHPTKENMLPSGPDVDADDEMGFESSAMNVNHFDTRRQWRPSSPLVVDVEDVTHFVPEHTNPAASIITDLASHNGRMDAANASTPVFEDDHSPASGPESGSSPLQPITPFGVYVDRAITSRTFNVSGNVVNHSFPSTGTTCGPQCHQMPSAPQGPAPDPAPEVVTPSATDSYKKLTEPLADWVSNFVWKACTTGYTLPSNFAQPIGSSAIVFSNSPPSHLAASVHSLLLSTLLQPSAVFLALWYITRLPIFFNAAPLGPECITEARFRGALFGDRSKDFDQDLLEASSPFRLIVLGCMLANKWLDDHTFSNKTWHTISNVPIQALNKLESLALDIFAYDLTISTRDWSQWLTRLMSHHMSLTSPVHPQPISRPSTNPHALVRMAIEEIIQAASAPSRSSVPEPVFVGLQERKREIIEKERAMVEEVLDIDLDEDGPLREEYLPKRRVSAAGSNHSSKDVQPFNLISNAVPSAQSWERRDSHNLEKSLPPPAKWSPAGDEPIHRERNRVSGQYVAVQPPVLHVATAYPVPYHPPIDVYAHYHWSTVPYAPVKPQSNFFLDFPAINGVDQQLTYSTYPYAPQIPISHARSQSLSYEDENFQARQHARTYSQTRFDYQCSDLRMTANDLTIHRQSENAWMGLGHYPYQSSAFAPIHNFNLHQAWIRT